MTPATLNRRASETYEAFPIHVEESVTVDDYEANAQQTGETITREIEADRLETAELRAAQERLESGEFRTQEDVERA